MSTKAAKRAGLEFQDAVRRAARLNDSTGNLHFEGMYVSGYLNFNWKGGIISVPHSHVVWFLTRGRWPEDGKNIDHINDNPMDNSPDNLQELTLAENHEKRRGRIVYASYGTGKHPHGLTVTHDKRDGRYYVRRQLSRGHGNGDLKNVRKGLGGFDTLDDAERAVARYIAEIEMQGAAHLPEAPAKGKKRKTAEIIERLPEIRQMRVQGMTFQQIANATGFSQATIYNYTKDIPKA